VQGRTSSAIKWATLVTAGCALLMLVPGINALLLIAAMLPLWCLDGLGVPGLGRELNGFFVPSAAGWSLAALLVWCACFAVLRYRAR